MIVKTNDQNTQRTLAKLTQLAIFQFIDTNPLMKYNIPRTNKNLNRNLTIPKKSSKKSPIILCALKYNFFSFFNSPESTLPDI